MEPASKKEARQTSQYKEGQHAKGKPQGWRLFRSRALEEEHYVLGLRKTVYAHKNAYIYIYKKTAMPDGMCISVGILSKLRSQETCAVNFAPRHEDVWGSRSITPPFLTSAFHSGEWSAHAPAALSPGKQPLVPIV
jgi:hypothetical protein